MSSDFSLLNETVHFAESVTFAPKNPSTPGTRSALINPPDPTSADNYRLVPPLGLGYIASWGRIHGHHVDVYDLALEVGHSLGFLREIGLFERYEIYGISTYSDNFSTTVQLVRCLRDQCREAFIVLGGYHATLLHEEILRDFPEVDAVVRHEGEVPYLGILEYVRERANFERLKRIPSLTWRDENGRIVVNPDRKENIEQNDLPFPSTDLSFAPANYMSVSDPATSKSLRTLNMVSSRGCPKRCTFCSIILINPLWRARTVDSLMSEVEYRYQQAPFGHILFQDANFFVNPKRSLEFTRRLYEFNPAIRWSGTATPDHVVRHTAVLADLALNCSYLELGIESGNDNSLLRFGKGNSVKINEEAITLLASSGIRLALDFIMFEPEMTLEDFRLNLQFLRRNELYGNWPVGFLFQELQLYPGTALRRSCEEKLGLPFSSHEVPPTPFFDPAVGEIFKIVSLYQQTVQAKTDVLIKHLNDTVNTLLFGSQDCRRSVPLTVALRKAQTVAVHLRHAPFSFFDDIVDSAEEQRAAAVDVHRVRAARLHREALDTLKALDSAAQEVGTKSVSGTIHVATL